MQVVSNSTIQASDTTDPNAVSSIEHTLKVVISTARCSNIAAEILQTAVEMFPQTREYIISEFAFPYSSWPSRILCRPYPALMIFVILAQ